MHRPVRVAIAVLLPLTFLAFSRADNAKIQRPAFDSKELEALLRTDWYGLYLKDKKIGYFRSARERVGEIIRESETFSMKLAAFGQKTELLMNQSTFFESVPPYRMIRAEMEQRHNPAPLEKIVLVRKDKGFESTYQTGTETSKKLLGDFDYNLADGLAQELWIRRTPQIGDRAVFKQFDVKDSKVHMLSSKVLAQKTSLVSGVNVRYYEVENESSKEMLKFVTRHDDQGRTLSGVIAIFELRLEPEQQAKNTDYGQDLFVMGMVKVDKKLGLTRNIKELVIRIDGKEGQIFEDGPRQSVADGPKGSKILKVGKKYGKPIAASKQELADCLEETNAYPISHAKIKALAKEAVAAAATPEEKVEKIVGFVNRFVKPKISSTMPNIYDLLAKKQGDCKSYALLVTNLARASGVPAREVSGLLYVGDDEKAFGGHAWNEVVLGGYWVPVDASLRETDIDAGHVCYGTEQKAAKNLLTTLGKMSFKVIDVK